MKVAHVRVCDEDICRRWECGENGVDDVWDEVESAMDGVFSKDGHLLDVGLGGHGVN